MRIWLTIVLPLLLATVGSWWLLRLLIPLLRRRMLDHPNARSSHSQPTPRGGGVVLVLVGGGGIVLMGSWLPLLVLPLAFVGFLDDRHDLPAALRFGVQIATALGLVLASPLLQVSLADGLSLLVLVVAITAVINFTNFMDGLDGLVAGCLTVSLTTVAIAGSGVADLWPLVGALLGFLIWNWSPARVFMGDVGSTYLGAFYVCVVLQASSWLEALAQVLLLTPLIADAGLCVPRRLLAGQQIFQAHRLHLFQRLQQAGWSHSQVSCLYVAATAALAFTLLWGGWPAVMVCAGAELLVGVWLDQRVAVSFTASLAAANAQQQALMN